MKKDEFYSLADYHSAISVDHQNIKARWTGEKRCPKKGEWYLSGAIIEAYQARNDMSTPYCIAELCQVVTEVKQVVIQIIKKEK